MAESSENDDLSAEERAAEEGSAEERPASIPDRLLFGDDAEPVPAADPTDARAGSAVERRRRGVIALAVVVAVLVVAGGLIWGLSPSNGSSSPAAANAHFVAAAATNQDAATAAYEKLHCPMANSVVATDYGSATSYLATCGAYGSAYLLGPAVLSGADAVLVSTGVLASGATADGSGIDVQLSTAGANAYASVAKELHQQAESGEGTGMLAMVLDGVVISAPVTQGVPFTKGEFLLSGQALTRADIATLSARMTTTASVLLFRPVLQFH